MAAAKRFDNLVTEQRNQATQDIDTLSTEDMIALINAEDAKAVAAVAEQRKSMAKAVERITESLRQGGRLFYMGSGTSGRLGVLDAAELLPTFGVGEEMVKAIMAGGSEAMFRPIEKAEDNADAGRQDFVAEHPCRGDVLVGITASGRTPYVLAAIAEAQTRGIHTIGVTCNPDSELARAADITIAPVVGPEVVTGSTRMKAGTAQKLVLNTLSTAVMIRLGKVYGNLMVDMQPTNEKLQRRAERIVADATGCSVEKAAELLTITDWNIKASIIMAVADCTPAEALAKLDQQHGVVSKAIASLRNER